MKTRFIDVDKNRDLICEIKEPILLYKKATIRMNNKIWFARTEGLIDIDENIIINFMTQNLMSDIDYL